MWISLSFLGNCLTSSHRTGISLQQPTNRTLRVSNFLDQDMKHEDPELLRSHAT